MVVWSPSYSPGMVAMLLADHFNLSLYFFLYLSQRIPLN